MFMNLLLDVCVDICYLLAVMRLVPWLSGRTSVFDRWTFPVLRSTYSCRVTTYVGKLSAIGQPTTVGQLSLSSFQGRYMSSKLQLVVDGVVCWLNCVISVW